MICLVWKVLRKPKGNENDRPGADFTDDMDLENPAGTKIVLDGVHQRDRSNNEDNENESSGREHENRKIT